MRPSLVIATLAMSTVAFAQQDGIFQIGYAANLNIGDSVVNLSNDGAQGGVFGAGVFIGVLAPTFFPVKTLGNLCANIYVFDPQEEEIGCCSCLVTPNGLNSLSVKSDLISNNLTPAVPTSVVIKILGTSPLADTTNALTVCNPATAGTAQTVTFGGPPVGPASFFFNIPKFGLLAWGTTLEPNSSPGTYNAVDVPFLNGTILLPPPPGPIVPPAPGSELYGLLTQLCNFIQANGTGFGICKSCRLGALGGAKQ